MYIFNFLIICSAQLLSHNDVVAPKTSNSRLVIITLVVSIATVTQADNDSNYCYKATSTRVLLVPK